MREEVILLNNDGSPIGTADKAVIHTGDTPLHLAFSCWLFNEDGQLLLTRRALGKKTWPGVWTNSFCGHPAPGETPEEAVYRRATFELGLQREAFASLELVLPNFQYRAVDASGVVENEICPVFVARLTADAQIQPNPDEVCESAWITPGGLSAAIEAAPFVFSPWLIEEASHEPLHAHLRG
ncbi:isopentenyl-diphosphate Delta-isomerase [Corynebacterium riegelii]|uniref:isopentenyl-diphosphate Delta-isomerase n=1 Tax=Corynebacterium riegelii TaxID=156976 RepID=UPI000C7785FE|nr:isopentenyl-diphosphate Delta-isomerase [Corynebacterium riegelii]PLA11830.1 isopentenyl-diphosphate delta-isomerase [Corynebacterium riegelii]